MTTPSTPTAPQASEDDFAALRAAFRFAPHLVWLLRGDGRALLVNDAVRAWCGASADAAAWEASCWPDEETRARFRAAVARGVAGEASRETLALRRADGEMIVLEIVAQPVDDPRLGRFVRLDGFDVTTRTRAESALRASEAKYAGILAIAADAIISTDDQARIVHYNQGAAQIFGYTAEEAIGQRIEMLIPERYRAAHYGEMMGFARGPRTARRMGERGEIYGLRKNGEEFPAEASISRLALPEGGMLFTVVLRDVTTRRRAEESARFLADASGRLATTIDVQETLRTVTELPVPFLADACVVDLLGEDGTADRSASAHADPRAHSTLDVPMITRDRVFGVMTLMILSPERRAFDDGDFTLARELGARCAMALDTARLYHDAQRATRARDEVLGVVSHDLRNPLSAIAMCARALMEHTGDERSRLELVTAIYQANGLANRMIQDLLDVAHIEAGRLKVERRIEEVEEIIARAVPMFEGQAADRGIEVRVDVAPDLPPVYADDARILQVLGNLVGNAAKFTPAGGAITVTARAVAGEVLISVSDTGPGIPAAEHELIFRRYWENRRTAGQRGTGLGLAISKGIIEAHGGRIWVESAVGSGSTFHFTLPLA